MKRLESCKNHRYPKFDCKNCIAINVSKPMKRIKKEVERCESSVHRTQKVMCNEFWGCKVLSPKPTKIEKLVIKEDWSEVTFEQQKDRFNVHMRYFEDDDNGGKWEGGSSSFSVPLKKLKDYLLSH